MMGGSPSWWNMHDELRSSSTTDHHQHHQEASANNLLITQTHPSNNNNPNNSSSVACSSSSTTFDLFLPPVLHLHNSYSSTSSSSSSSSSSSTCSSSLLPFTSNLPHHDDHHRPQDFPHSWSQLLLGGLAGEQEERFGPSLFQSTRMIGNSVDDVKQEVTSPNINNNNNNNNHNLFGNQNEEQEVGVSNRPTTNWSLSSIPSSSPKSCVTSLSNNININTNTNTNTNINNNNNQMLNFSTSKISLQSDNHLHASHSNFECNTTSNGDTPNKKPRVQSSSTPPLKVRKEKLGDRITALHQLVSPFGKTDTASVLLEAIGYIRFLQGQIEALSSPYLGNNNNNNNASNQHSVHGERNGLFPDHPGQLLNDSCLKRRGALTQEDIKDATSDLKSRGLCLVPLSCTQIVASDNGADYWAPAFSGGF